VCYNRAVRTQTKLAIAAVIAIFFAGFVLRAAVRLASVAMHSLFFAILLVVVIVWIVAKMR
jgi:heme A synthase